MQLKKPHHHPIHPALAGACASVLTTTLQAAPLGGALLETEDESPTLAPQPRYPHWLGNSRADASSLLYREGDGRILVWENTLTLRHDIDTDRSLGLSATSDLITGASPIGTVPSQTPQIITSASGQSTTIPPGELPLFSVSDLRLAVAGQYRYPLSETLRAASGASFAVERDFSSIGLTQTFSHGLRHALTTWEAGLAMELDDIRPLGGAPPPLAREGSFTLQGGEDADDIPGKRRLSLEWQLGLSQVLSRRLLLQGQYFGGHLSGYLTDPYKRISYVSALSGEPLPGQGTWTERRPQRRTFHGLSLSLLTYLPRDPVWRNRIRLFRDDWQIRAVSIDSRLDLPLTGPTPHGLTLHARLYRQSAAWFYRYRLVDGPSDLPGVRPQDITPDPARLPAASADWRLGNLQDLLIDIGYRRALPSVWWLDGELRTRIGRYVQRDRDGLFPRLNAWYTQLDLSLRW